MTTATLIVVSMIISFVIGGVLGYRLGYISVLDQAEKSIGAMVEEHLEEMRVIRGVVKS